MIVQSAYARGQGWGLIFGLESEICQQSLSRAQRFVTRSAGSSVLIKKGRMSSTHRDLHVFERVLKSKENNLPQQKLSPHAYFPADTRPLLPGLG